MLTPGNELSESLAKAGVALSSAKVPGPCPVRRPWDCKAKADSLFNLKTKPHSHVSLLTDSLSLNIGIGPSHLILSEFLVYVTIVTTFFSLLSMQDERKKNFSCSACGYQLQDLYCI